MTARILAPPQRRALRDLLVELEQNPSADYSIDMSNETIVVECRKLHEVLALGWVCTRWTITRHGDVAYRVEVVPH
jgi:hypothetical protein